MKLLLPQILVTHVLLWFATVCDGKFVVPLVGCLATLVCYSLRPSVLYICKNSMPCACNYYLTPHVITPVSPIEWAVYNHWTGLDYWTSSKLQSLTLF